MATESKGCPHCKNKMGFVFGTCIECGYNDIDHTFHYIEVSVKDLPDSDLTEWLIEKHARKTRDRCA